MNKLPGHVNVHYLTMRIIIAIIISIILNNITESMNRNDEETEGLCGNWEE